MFARVCVSGKLVEFASDSCLVRNTGLNLRFGFSFRGTLSFQEMRSRDSFLFVMFLFESHTWAVTTCVCVDTKRPGRFNKADFLIN